MNNRYNKTISTFESNKQRRKRDETNMQNNFEELWGLLTMTEKDIFLKN